MSPKYESVPSDPQLPARPRASMAATQPEAAPPLQRATKAPNTDLVTITVAIPRDVRQSLKVAAAVHGFTIQQAAAEAFRMWLAVQNTNPSD